MNSRNHPPDPYTAAQRSMKSRAAAHAMHAAGKTNTGPARDKFSQRFELEVDPDGLLPVAERLRRAEHARRAYFTRLALMSARARSKGNAA